MKKRVGSHYADNKTWKIVKDPDESWSPNTFLSKSEINDLHFQNFLAIGTTFRNERTGSIIVIRSIRGGNHPSRQVE